MQMQGVGASAQAGDVRVFTTSGRGATPEEWAELTMRKLIVVSEQSPEPVRLQVEAFRDRIHVLLVAAMKNAVKSDRTNIINLLTEAGHPELAQAVRNL